MRKGVLLITTVLVLALAGTASANPGTGAVERLVKHRTAARFVSAAHPRVSAHCHRRGVHRFKCHFAVRSGEDVFRGRVRVRLLHAGGARMLWGELHLGGFDPSACASHPAFTVSGAHVDGFGTIPATHVSAQSC